MGAIKIYCKGWLPPPQLTFSILTSHKLSIHWHCTKISSKSGRFRLDFCYLWNIGTNNDVLEAIRKMEGAWVKVNGGNFSIVNYRDLKGELRPCYSLTKTECLYIATKFNDRVYTSCFQIPFKCNLSKKICNAEERGDGWILANFATPNRMINQKLIE